MQVLPAWFMLGLMDPSASNPWLNYTLEKWYQNNKNIAYESALNSIVLLKNDNNILLQNGNLLTFPLSS